MLAKGTGNRGFPDGARPKRKFGGQLPAGRDRMRRVMSAPTVMPISLVAGQRCGVPPADCVHRHDLQLALLIEAVAQVRQSPFGGFRQQHLV